MSFSNRTISHLLEKNFSFASVLNRYGIKFFEHSHHTISELCDIYNLTPDSLEKNWELLYKESAELPFSEMNISDLIYYLQQTHHSYIRFKLPFIQDILNHLKVQESPYTEMIDALLKFYPTFCHDFIEHIEYEENVLFPYIKGLYDYINGEVDQYRFFRKMAGKNLKKLLEGQHPEDNISQLKTITNQYFIADDMPLEFKVMMSELQSFESDILCHADLEDNVFIPKATVLEQKAKLIFFRRVRYN